MAACLSRQLAAALSFPLSGQLAERASSAAPPSARLPRTSYYSGVSEKAFRRGVVAATNGRRVYRRKTHLGPAGDTLRVCVGQISGNANPYFSYVVCLPRLCSELSAQGSALACARPLHSWHVSCRSAVRDAVPPHTNSGHTGGADRSLAMLECFSLQISRAACRGMLDPN